MKYIFIAVSLLLLSVACNRPAAKVAATQPNSGNATQPRPVMKDRPAREEVKMQRVKEEVDINPSPTNIGKRLEPSPSFTIDPVSGEKKPTLLLELKESGCLSDTCAQYTIRLFADYTFQYIGIANVDLLGEYTAKAEFNPLLKVGPLTSKGGFFSMNEVYPMGTKNSGISTVATTTIYVDHRGRKNTVTEISAAPEGFAELEKEVLSWVERVIWVPVE